MPSIPVAEATEMIAQAVMTATPGTLKGIYREFLTDGDNGPVPQAAEIARLIHGGGVDREMIVDLFRVMCPGHRRARYEEEEDAIYFNEEATDYAESLN